MNKHAARSLDLFAAAVAGSDAHPWETIAHELALALRNATDSDRFCLDPECWRFCDREHLWCGEHASIVTADFVRGLVR